MLKTIIILSRLTTLTKSINNVKASLCIRKGENECYLSYRSEKEVFLLRMSTGPQDYVTENDISLYINNGGVISSKLLFAIYKMVDLDENNETRDVKVLQDVTKKLKYEGVSLIEGNNFIFAPMNIIENGISFRLYQDSFLDQIEIHDKKLNEIIQIVRILYLFRNNADTSIELLMEE